MTRRREARERRRRNRANRVSRWALSSWDKEMKTPEGKAEFARLCRDTTGRMFEAMGRMQQQAMSRGVHVDGGDLLLPAITQVMDAQYAELLADA